MMGEANWRNPLKWQAAAKKAGARDRVFCASMCDVFEEHPDPEVNATLNAARARLWSMIQETPDLDWMLLTKRPENIGVMMPDEWHGPGAIPPNVWLGTSVCGDHTDRKMIENLVNGRWNLNLTPTVRFLSYEPAIGFPGFLDLEHNDFVRDVHDIDWIIVGGESGPRARRFKADWARMVVEYGERQGVPVFVKQMGANPSDTSDMIRGENAPEVPERLSLPLRHRAGADEEEWPSHLRVRQFPKGLS
jgi:protein gp37